MPLLPQFYPSHQYQQDVGNQLNANYHQKQFVSCLITNIQLESWQVQVGFKTFVCV